METDMERNEFVTADWCNAFTLQERADLFRQAVPTGQESDPVLARQRETRWREQIPFRQESSFAQRLALVGLTSSQFRDIVGAPIELIRDRLSASPCWLNTLKEAFSDPHGNGTGQGATPEEAPSSVIDPMEPLIHHGRELLGQGVRRLLQAFPSAPFDKDTIEDALLKGLAERLSEMIARTFTLELHVARLIGGLAGDTPQERFQSFVKLLKEPEAALKFLREYPVLARQLAMAVEAWLMFSLELVERLCADWVAIRETFAPAEDPGYLISCRSTGDQHRGGRHVVILEFSSRFQVVYKPRSLALDCHFQELLRWMNARGQEPPFRTLRILDRGDYGWTEFVSPRSCESECEIRRFYERQGGNLAVLYLLNATDFHHENVIAAGEHPVLIDLETLFHQRPPERHQDAVYTAGTTMTDSVLGVGLLPHRSWMTESSDGIDLSGLGTADGQASPFAVPQFEDVGTDQMRWTRKPMTYGANDNRPTLDGTAIGVRDFTQSVEAGFSNTYRLLLRRRADLLAVDGPLARFAGDDLRIVLRPTQTYAVLLREGFHPDMLRDALERDRLFDHLWIHVEHRPHLSKVIAAEVDDLENGDIPIFGTRPDSRDLWTSTGEPIKDFFDDIGIEVVRRRLSQFGADDLERQLWFIRASFTTLETLQEAIQSPTVYTEHLGTVPDSDRLLTAAIAVADRLTTLAIRSGDQATWIGLTVGSKQRTTIAPLTIDLYDGLAGVVLFLAHVGHITGGEGYTDLARAGLASVRCQADLHRIALKAIGGFTGWGGLIYLLSSLGTLWNDPTLHEEAAAIVQSTVPLIEHDDYLDVMGGAAGCLASIIALYHAAPSRRILAAAEQCGDHLVARAQQMASGNAWLIPGELRPLTGFSHGAAGIGWALLNLATLTGHERYRTAAGAAIAYERSQFSAENRNWPDLRARKTTDDEDDNCQQFMTAWCHGAAGIGLARLQALGQLDDPQLEHEVRIALQTTLETGFGGNHSLCHGELGNLDLLVQAGQVLGEADLHRYAYRRAAAVLADIDRIGWQCGLPSGVESPGLMTGIAGIGYQFLRLVDPIRVPSVLCLAPPSSR
jgi:type 2 lantibiotic biosynthesis protein LanM